MKRSRWANPVRRTWSRLNLQARLLLVCAVTLIAGTALILSVTARLGGIGKAEDTRAHVERAVRFMAASLEAGALVGDQARMRAVLADWLHTPGVVRVGWRDAAGSQMEARGDPQPRLAPAWFAQLTGLKPLYVEHAVLSGGRDFGKVYLEALPAEQVDAIWRELLRDVQLATVGILCMLVGLMVVTRTGLRPLLDLGHAARRFGEGDYSYRMVRDGTPEMVAASRAFNLMAGRLQEQMGVLRAAGARNRMLASIVEQASVAIVAADREGRIASWNYAAERLFGYRAEELLGQPVAVLCGPEDPLAQARAVERIQARGTQTQDTRWFTCEGKPVDVVANMSPIFDDEGRHLGEVTVLRDVSETRRAQDALRTEQQRARVTLDAITDAVMTVDDAGLVEYLNPAAEDLLGLGTVRARGRRIGEVFPVRRADGTPVSDLTADGGIRNGLREEVREEELVLRRDGMADRVLEVTVSSVQGAPTGPRGGCVIACRDVTEERKLLEWLGWQATHDELTGLANRRQFERRLGALVEQSAAGRCHALIMLDLDQFKVVNDTCGHVAGDEMLRQVAAVVESTEPGHACAARLGGDEFGLLLCDVDEDAAVAVAERLRERLSQYRFLWKDRVFSASASVGVALIDTGQTVQGALVAADAACYAAKELGRNRVRLHRPDDHELNTRQREMEWVSAITEAITARRFRLFAQPIVALGDTTSVPRYEVLVRMIDVAGADVQPMSFIPAAERFSLMPAIDRVVVDKALAFYAEHWLHGGAPNPPVLAVNLSGASVNDEAFLDYVLATFTRYGVAPGRICFEITETAAIGNLARATRFMQRLKEVGCSFALDDFGSGFSSFAYLKRLPVDYLKIDGSFVRDMADDPIDRAMVGAIQSIGSALGIRTVAEFVDNERTVQLLREIGVDYAQGFGVGRPRPLEELLYPGTAGVDAANSLLPGTPRISAA